MKFDFDMLAGFKKKSSSDIFLQGPNIEMEELNASWSELSLYTKSF